MLVHKGVLQVSTDETEAPLCVAEQGVEIYWDGFLYVAGELGQQPSAQYFCRRAASVGLQDAIADLKGCFFAIVRMPNGSTHAFVDPSGLFSAYYSDRCVARSFLDLVETSKLRRSEISASAMMELLQTGNIYFGNTYFPVVRKLAFNQLATIQNDGCVRIDNRDVPVITDTPANCTFLESFTDFAYAIRNQKISVDITGGFDSRLLVASLFHHDVEFELALSGHDDHIDVKLGRQVANTVNRNFTLTHHNTTRIDEELPFVLRKLDALGGMLTAHHRILQLQQQRADRGITLTLKGQGGELYKDFFWMQEFPFYNSKKSNVARINRLRMELELFPKTLLSDEYALAMRQSHENRVQHLEQYCLDTNTQTCDNIYFRERVQTWGCRNLTGGMLHTNKQHSPLCEVHRVQYGFHAPRRQRFAAFFHRNVISSVSHELAMIPTTDNTSASDNIAVVALDMVKLTKTRSKKLYNKLAERYLNRSVARSAPTDRDEANDAILRSQLAADAIEALCDYQVFRRPIQITDIPQRFRTHAIVLGWFLQQIPS